MFADLSHSTSTSLTNRLTLLAWRLSHAFEPKGAQRLPAELGRLSDHLLRDIGVDRRSLPPAHAHLVTPPDVLHSPVAMREFLATTVR